MSSCKNLFKFETQDSVVDFINKNIGLKQKHLAKGIGRQIFGSRGGSSVFIIPYKDGKAVIKMCRIKQIPDISTFNPYFRRENHCALSLLREIIVGCYFKNNKLYQNNIPAIYKWGATRSINNNSINVYYIQEYIVLL